MEAVLKFIGEHIILVSVVLAALFALLIFMIFKGVEIHRKDGTAIKIGGVLKNGSSSKNAVDIKTFLLAVSFIQDKKSKYKEKYGDTRNGLVSDCIRHAEGSINKLVSDAKRSFFVMTYERTDLSLLENNYRVTIFNLLLDKATEKVKTYLYDIIRKDHFNSKTENELEQMGEDCVTIFERNIVEEMDFNIEILKDLKKNYEKKIKDEVSEIIYVSAKKYEMLKKYDLQFKEMIEKELEEELISKFNLTLSQAELGALMGYDD